MVSDVKALIPLKVVDEKYGRSLDFGVKSLRDFIDRMGTEKDLAKHAQSTEKSNLR